MSIEPKVTRFGADPTTDQELATKAYVDSSGGSGFFEELGRTLLAVAGDTISVTPIALRKYLRLIVIVLDTGGTVRPTIRFNNDSGNNYKYRRESNNVGAVSVNQPEINISNVLAMPAYSIVNVINSDINPKMVTSMAVGEGVSGSGNAPNSWTCFGVWQNNDQVTRVDIVNPGTGDYAIGSELIVLGHD